MGFVGGKIMKSIQASKMTKYICVEPWVLFWSLKFSTLLFYSIAILMVISWSWRRHELLSNTNRMSRTLRQPKWVCMHCMTYYVLKNKKHSTKFIKRMFTHSKQSTGIFSHILTNEPYVLLRWAIFKALKLNCVHPNDIRCSCNDNRQLLEFNWWMPETSRARNYLWFCTYSILVFLAFCHTVSKFIPWSIPEMFVSQVWLLITNIIMCCQVKAQVNMAMAHVLMTVISCQTLLNIVGPYY